MKIFRQQINYFLTVPAIIWQILFLYIPLTFVLAASFFSHWDVISLTHLTLANFKAVANSIHLKIIFKSLVQSIFIATTCLLIAYPVAYLFAVSMRRWRTFFLFFLLLPFWTNFLVHIYAWFYILERHGLINSLLLKLGIISEPLSLLYTQGAIQLVMIYCYLPFMMLPLFSVLEKFNTTLVEASLDLGATPTQTFFKVTLPLTLSGIRNGFFLVMVPVFGEYAIPSLVGGDKYLNVGTLIGGYYLRARNPMVSAAFTVLSGIAILIAVRVIYELLRSPKTMQIEE